MSVELEPSSQLGFHRPLTQLVKRTLTITNSNPQPVAFKVKTTAPKQYCVRPNSGRIEPNERVEVQVLLQPMKEEPAPGTKCKDKFLVQSAVITPDRETKTLAELWTTVEADVKSGKEGVVHEQKIRCAYLQPVSGGIDETYNQSTAEGNDTSINATPSASGFLNGATPSRFEDSRSAPSSAISQKPDTRSLHGGSDAGLPNESTYSDATTIEKVKAAVPTSVEEAKVAAANAATAVGTAATGAAASLGLTGGNSVSTGDSSGLQKQLDEARAEIKRLKEIIASKEGEGLRQRNIGSGSQASTTQGPGAATATISQDGIPLPMVGALCAGVFVITWLFF